MGCRGGANVGLLGAEYRARVSVDSRVRVGPNYPQGLQRRPQAGPFTFCTSPCFCGGTFGLSGIDCKNGGM